jgi:hypothetical protein
VRRALWALGLAALGCRTRPAPADAEAVAHICWTEQRLRTAANPEKAPYLTDMQRAGCTAGSDACIVRDHCAAAYGLHVDALALTQAAKQQLADGHAETAAKLLGSAEEKLEQARAPIAECTDRAAALRRQYGL